MKKQHVPVNDPDRLAFILERLRAGDTMKAAGRALRITGSRVAQILAAAGYDWRTLKPPPPPPPPKPPRKRCAYCGKEMKGRPAQDGVPRACRERACQRQYRKWLYNHDPRFRALMHRAQRLSLFRKQHPGEPPPAYLYELQLERQRCMYCGAPLYHYKTAEPERACMAPDCQKRRHSKGYKPRPRDEAREAARKAAQEAAKRVVEQQRAAQAAAERALHEKLAPYVAAYRARTLTISQRALAKQLGIKRSTLQAILSGRRHAEWQQAEQSASAA
jgi:ribosome-binding protein aMBF1 (putative translation factor)